MSDEHQFSGSSKSGHQDEEAGQDQNVGSLGRVQPEGGTPDPPPAGVLREGPSGNSSPKPSPGQAIGGQTGTPVGPGSAGPSQPARRSGCFGSVLVLPVLVAALLIAIL
ncbi:MAG: hypothetical protein ACK2U9_12675 [Anaerolineae bacterium]